MAYYSLLLGIIPLFVVCLPIFIILEMDPIVDGKQLPDALVDALFALIELSVLPTTLIMVISLVFFVGLRDNPRLLVARIALLFLQVGFLLPALNPSYGVLSFG